MGAQGSHAGTAPDVDRFLLRGLEMEIAKWSDRPDDIAGLQTENVCGANPWRTILSRRRRSDADVESQCALGGRVARKGIVVAPAGGGIAGDELKQILASPNRCIGFRDIE